MTDFEDRLRRSLSARAEQIVPADRLAEIAAGVQEPSLPGAGSGRRTWWVALGAAAAALAIVLSFWAVNGRPGSIGQPGGSPEPSPTVASSQPPSPSPSTTASPSPSTEPTDFVGDYTIWRVTDEVAGTPRGVLGLRRVILPSSVPRAEVALEAARSAMLPVPSAPGAWPDGVEVRSVEASATEITVTLAVSNPDAGMTKEGARLAILAVVYSVQDALESSLPVRFVTLDGSTTLLHPAWPVSQTYQRAPAGEEYQDLVDVLITNPTPVPVTENQYPSGASVVIKGEATAYEAMVHWELTLEGSAVSSGDVMASEGAPGRGAFTITLTGLADTRPGPYLLTVQSRGGESGTTVLSSDIVRFYVGAFS